MKEEAVPDQSGRKRQDEYVFARPKGFFYLRLRLFRGHLKSVADVSFAEQLVEFFDGQLFPVDAAVSVGADGVAQRKNGDVVFLIKIPRHPAASVRNDVETSFHNT